MQIDRNSVDRFLGSTSFRLSVVFAGLMIAAFVAAGLGALLATQSIAERQARESVVLELRSIRQEVTVEGMQAAVAAIENRASRPGALEYRLTAPNGELLAGNLMNSDLGVGWKYVDFPYHEGLRPGQDDLIVLSAKFRDGSTLSVGDDLERGESVRIAILRALFWIGALSAIVSIVIGLWITHRTLRRMDRLSATLVSVSQGDLSARSTARTPPRDDLDQLTAGTNAMLDKIATLVSNIRRVSSEVAHDLRTPLSHVRQDLEGAAAIAPPNVITYIDSAQNRIDGLLRTFDAMLRLAEIEAGSARARFESIDVGLLVERVADAYRPDVEAAGGVLVTAPMASFTTNGDADLLTQALANLVENALKHGGARPCITLAVRAVDDTQEIIVSDNGLGIAQHDRELVLAPFTRLDASRTTPGSGLGLAIVAAIARLHDAKILLEDAKPGLRIVLRWDRRSSIKSV